MFMEYNSLTMLLLWSFAGIVCFMPLLIKSVMLKYIVIPIILIIIYASFTINDQFIGRPRYETPQYQFIFKSYSTSTIKDKKYITMWIVDKDGDLLIRFPWTEEIFKALEKAKKRSEEGLTQIGKFNKKQKQEKYNEEEPDTLEFYDFPVEKIYPKE